MVNQARQSVGRQTRPAGGLACTPLQDRPGQAEGGCTVRTVIRQTGPGETLVCTLPHGGPGQAKRWPALHHMAVRTGHSLGMRFIAGQAMLGGMYIVLPIYPCNIHR